MIGVAAFAYVLIHFSLYTASQAFDLEKVASEIVLRIYLTIGFAALLGLAALAATSTDGMVRRLGGKRWQLSAPAGLCDRRARGHSLLLPVEARFVGADDHGRAVVLAARLPTAAVALRRARVSWRWRGSPRSASPRRLATALGEAVYFGLAFDAPLMRVLETNLSLVTGIRPAVIVLAIGLAVTAAGVMRPSLIPAEKRRTGSTARRQLTPSR